VSGDPRPACAKLTDHTIASMSAPYTIEMIGKIIDDVGADNLTAKKVRTMLEEQLGLESGALKANKDDISKKIDEALAARVRTSNSPLAC
jgi:hypothetical protein